MNIFLFLLTNLIGFLTIGGLGAYAFSADLIPTNLPPELMSQFQLLFFGGTMIAWIISGVVSIMFLFLKGSIRFVFLMLPATIPAAYGIYILNMFNVGV